MAQRHDVAEQGRSRNSTRHQVPKEPIGCVVRARKEQRKVQESGLNTHKQMTRWSINQGHMFRMQVIIDSMQGCVGTSFAEPQLRTKEAISTTWPKTEIGEPWPIKQSNTKGSCFLQPDNEQPLRKKLSMTKWHTRTGIQVQGRLTSVQVSEVGGIQKGLDVERCHCKRKTGARRRCRQGS